jgi:ribonuclease R
MEVEREVVDLYRAIFMQDAIGRELPGTVSAIVGSGFFVALDDPFVEVLVRSETLGREAYEPDDDGLSLVGQRSGDRISVGERLLVGIDEVSIERRTTYAHLVGRLDLGLASEPNELEGRPVRKRRATSARGSTMDRLEPQASTRARATGPSRRSSPSQPAKERDLSKPGKPTKPGKRAKARKKPSRSERKTNGQASRTASKKGAAKGSSRGKAKARKKR